MPNLLSETIEVLQENGKDEKDVLWVGNKEIKATWDNFKSIANIEYDAGYGSAQVAEDLLVVGKDFWLEREEYDGSEWWSYKEYPTSIGKYTVIKALTVTQAEKLGYDVSCGWEGLNNINKYI